MHLFSGQMYLARNGERVLISFRDGRWWRGSSITKSPLFWTDDGHCEDDSSFDILLSMRKIQNFAEKIKRAATRSNVDAQSLVDVIVDSTFEGVMTPQELITIRNALLKEVNNIYFF